MRRFLHLLCVAAPEAERKISKNNDDDNKNQADTSRFVVLLQRINGLADLAEDLLHRQLGVHLQESQRRAVTPPLLANESAGGEKKAEEQFEPLPQTDLPDDAAALVEGDDGLGGFVVEVQAFLDGLLVVVGAAAGLAALQQPLGHGLGLRIHVQQQAGFADLQRGATKGFVPILGVRGRGITCSRNFWRTVPVDKKKKKTLPNGLRPFSKPFHALSNKSRSGRK